MMLHSIVSSLFLYSCIANPLSIKKSIVIPFQYSTFSFISSMNLLLYNIYYINKTLVKGDGKMKEMYIEDFEQWEKEFTFYTEEIVRFSDVDMYGHLNNVVPFSYFEHARIEYFKWLNVKNNWGSQDEQCIPVAADLQCDYLKQVYYGEKLRIYVKTARVGNSSLDLHYMVKNEKDEIVLTGRGALVQINKETGKPHRWTEEQKVILYGK